ncbi:uncharacterized protein LOC122377447 [Amphibalanus amphitrite]|uniref:uncharacterized protein LOC122377447 n=1 Tax=Amphibalanus amphitrite TaxID=1232801 RepID=UPI001C902AE0|nr:uncharacterized protein LOC122377447 [Amphibalanus amphitrite]
MDTSIELDGVLTRACTKHLIFSFIKYLLYQRGQIPFQFDSLRKYAGRAANEVEPDLNLLHELKDEDWCSDAKGVRRHQQLLRQNLMQARHARRRLKRDERLQKRIKMFLTKYDECDQQLSDALDSCSWPDGVRVALLLGSSAVSPKEVYVLHFPAIAAQFDRHPRCLQHQRGARQLFRTLVTCSPLLELTSRQLAPTNLHVLLRTAPGGGGGTPLVPRPAQTFRRGTVIHIRLQHGARALAESVPVSPVAVSPCCGRAAPRRLQACCAQFAAEMGLSLLDASLSPAPPVNGLGRRTEVGAGRWPPESPDLSRGDSCSTSSGGCSSAGGELSYAAPCDWAAGAGSEDGPEPEPEPEPIWCQIPVTLRGFRTPAGAAAAPTDWLATTE